MLFRSPSGLAITALTVLSAPSFVEAGSRAPRKAGKSAWKVDAQDDNHHDQADGQNRVVNGEDVSQYAHQQYKWVTPIEVNVPNTGASQCGGK